jgi:hypothetical protein
MALFSDVRNSIVKNVHVRDIHVTGTTHPLTTVVGRARDSIILNSSATGLIYMPEPLRALSLGGLVGYAINSEVLYSFSKVTIYTSEFRGTIGGIVGRLWNSTLSNSFFNGSIIADYIESVYPLAGGLVGFSNLSTISNSYSSGHQEFIGTNGIAGTMGGSTVVSSFWNVDKIGSTNTYYRVWQNENDIQNSFYLTTSEMKCPSIFVKHGWDFEETWDINPDVNNGFPFLRNTGPHLSLSEPDVRVLSGLTSFVYPNPVRGSNVSFALRSQKTDFAMSSLNTEIKLFNIRGQIVYRSNDFQLINNLPIFTWNRRDMNERKVATGVYFYQIRIYNETFTGRFLILRD